MIRKHVNKYKKYDIKINVEEDGIVFNVDDEEILDHYVKKTEEGIKLILNEIEKYLKLRCENENPNS